MEEEEGELLGLNCASFAVNLVDPVFLSNPSSFQVDAVADLISQGAEIERVTIKGVAKLGLLAPLFHLCKAIGEAYGGDD